MLTNRQLDYIRNLPKEIAEKPVKIFPWKRKGLILAQNIVSEISAADPNLEIVLVGSIPLKIAGQKDIDLVSTAPSSQFLIHCEMLIKIIGKPNKVNQDSIVWHFIKNGYEISFYIVDPDKSDQYKRQIYTDHLFKNNLRLVSEYERLKISLNGFPYRIYLEKKFEFFNRMINI